MWGSFVLINGTGDATVQLVFGVRGKYFALFVEIFVKIFIYKSRKDINVLYISFTIKIILIKLTKLTYFCRKSSVTDNGR